MMRHSVSPMPIGFTTGFLSRAMRRHANKGKHILDQWGVVHRHLAVRARDWQRALEAVL